MFGFFKRTKKDKISVDTNSNKNIQTALQGENQKSSNSILNEEFTVIDPITQERNSIICDKFIAHGLREFAEKRFDEATLNELSYNELCGVYNNIQWFVTNVSTVYQKEAPGYKALLREILLKKIRNISLYVIYTTVTELPLVLGEGQFFLFTNKNFAVMQAKEFNKAFGCLKVEEISPELFEHYFGEYYCAGYEQIVIDGKVKIGLKELYTVRASEEYGNVCTVSRVGMIDYKQNIARVNCNAQNEDRELLTEEKKQLNSLMTNVVAHLLNDNLLLPVEFEKGMPKSISVPMIPFPDGSKYIGLFTDQYAINSYYKKAVSCMAIPDLIKDQYCNIKDDISVSGILINPGREEFMLTKNILSQVFKG